MPVRKKSRIRKTPNRHKRKTSKRHNRHKRKTSKRRKLNKNNLGVNETNRVAGGLNENRIKRLLRELVEDRRFPPKISVFGDRNDYSAGSDEWRNEIYIHTLYFFNVIITPRIKRYIKEYLINKYIEYEGRLKEYAKLHPDALKQSHKTFQNHSNVSRNQHKITPKSS